MPFWHTKLSAWAQAWEAAGLSPLPRVTLSPPDRPEDLTINVFPFLRLFKGDTDALLKAVLSPLEGDIAHYELVKGFLNVRLSPDFWRAFLSAVQTQPSAGYTHIRVLEGQFAVFEYPSPNTNKPLHLGHLRNIALGQSVSALWERAGATVRRVNLYNDRGIHIAKSMVGWQRFFRPQTPSTAGKKGDHFVGDCYVAFEKAYKAEVEALVAQGLPEAEAMTQAPLFQEAQEVLRRWEAGDPDVRHLWETMNSWVYDGFAETFQRLGVQFDKIYYESETYTLGKALVEEGLSKGLFARSEDGSVWADLTAEGLGRKVLLRRDGTSVYITQDLGTADLRYRDFPAMTRSIYVIANEQDHHMQVLIALLRRLGRPYADALYHLSYGMVELPTGRMKTREGTVVDADDLLEEMRARALDLTDESIPPDKHEETAEGVGQAAIRFYLLRVEPKKNIVFDPAESIDLKGFTGPFLQYGYVRALRLREKAETQGIRLTPPTEVPPLEKEEALLLRHLYGLPAFLEAAALSYNPALIAHYGYELTQRYNEFYQKLSVLRAEEPVRSFRLALSYAYEVAVRTVLELLHIPLVTYM